MNGPNFSASIVLCARNPPTAPFIKTLETLCSQTVPRHLWEFIIIDDGSTEFPTIPPAILEALSPEQYKTTGLGIFEIRRYAIEKSSSPLLIFIDDDNYIANDYIEKALQISQDWPGIGVWGGTIAYEGPPLSEKVISNLYYYAVREISEPSYCSFYSDKAVPFGAGICIRKSIAEAWSAELLDGSSLLSRMYQKKCFPARSTVPSGDDTWMSFFAIHSGWGMGIFPSLSMRHAVAKERFANKKFLKLVKDRSCNARLIHLVDQRKKDFFFWPFVLLLKLFSKIILHRKKYISVLFAEWMGEWKACQTFYSFNQNHRGPKQKQ